MEPHKDPASTVGRRANRLAKEKSPYLLQHAFNPVDWHPWGDEAFRKARERDVPIFLSIGYSTCHWCHVMERESFEDAKIAEFLNERFVPVKVDREERPDVDAVYMAAVMAMTHGGGWPLSVFLAPDGKPFYGGTYFPPEDNYGRPGFLTVLKRLDELWRTDRRRLLESAAQIAEAIRPEPPAAGMVVLGTDTLAAAAARLQAGYDAAHGGFSPPPKFPRAHEISFLLRQHFRRPDPRALAMVTHTLDAMAAGGLYDHLGGGFHRYSTDARWLVPHFEKMLYDQALLVRAYVEAHQVTGRPDYARVARETIGYVLRDLRDRRGAFHSAEDADSEGEEGKFYVWRPSEVEAALGPERARAFSAHYGVTAAGNFEHGASILHVARPAAETAKALGLPAADLERILAEGRARLFEARGRRVRPHLDDKVLTDWNGLMISALAVAGSALDEPAYVEAAGRSAEFVLAAMQRDGRLLHRYRDAEAAGPGFLDDYAFFGQGLLDLHAATFDPRWLRESARLAREMVRLFRDEADGGMRLVGVDGERLIVPTREVYDGAIPSGNSAAAAWLLRLGRITMDRDLEARGRDVVRAFSAEVGGHPAGFPHFLAAVDLVANPTREIVVAGDRSDPAVQAMLRAVRSRFLPDAVLLLHEPGESGRAIREMVPFVREQVMRDGKATAYVCRNYACERPTTDLARLVELLQAGGPGGGARPPGGSGGAP
jgi:uncharacterized protein YyaL (SSP411 family)